MCPIYFLFRPWLIHRISKMTDYVWFIEQHASPTTHAMSNGFRLKLTDTQNKGIVYNYTAYTKAGVNTLIPRRPGHTSENCQHILSKFYPEGVWAPKKSHMIPLSIRYKLCDSNKAIKHNKYRSIFSRPNGTAGLNIEITCMQPLSLLNKLERLGVYIYMCVCVCVCVCV